MHNKTQVANRKTKNFLEEIVNRKLLEASQKKRKIQKSGLLDKAISENSDFLNFKNIFAHKDSRRLGLIAELKFASPTSPHLGSPEELVERVKQYESAGADAISIITEKHFFKGDIAFISQVKKNVLLPVLQKDFVVNPIQIYEAKEAGSDALLLIARLVDAKTLKKFVRLCFVEGIEPVVEINSEEDLEKAIGTNTHIIAVNARNLETFTIDIISACMLMEKIPDQFIRLGFSGISSQKEALLYKESGANGILVGTGLMRTKNIKRFIDDLEL